MTETTTAVDSSADRPDQAAAEEFAGRLVGILADSSLALMFSIGHQLRLFEVLAKLPDATSQEIADAAGLQERYVREWLGAMTTGRIVTYDPEPGTYALPPEHAASLTRQAGPDNLSGVMQFIAFVGRGRAAGGELLPPRRWCSVQRVRALPRPDGRGQRDRPRRGATRRHPPACSWCDRTARRRYRRRRHRLWPRARRQSHGRGVPRQPVHRFRLLRSRDRCCTTRGRIPRARQRPLRGVRRRHARHSIAVRPCHRLRRHPRPSPPRPSARQHRRRPSSRRGVPHGRHQGLEQPRRQHRVPWGPFLYTASTLHCMAVSLALDGDALGTAWGAQTAVRMVGEAGFGNVEVKEIETDPFNSYYVATR